MVKGWTYIPLRRRGGTIVDYAIVDLDVADDIKRHRWCLVGHTGRHGEIRYACRRPGPAGKQRSQLMHRYILLGDVGVWKHGDPEVDHVNGHYLDNRRSNLRLLASGHNQQNRQPYGASGLRGVYYHKRNGRWIARVNSGGKKIHLGLFDTKEAAARVASDWRRLHMPYSVEATD